MSAQRSGCSRTVEEQADPSEGCGEPYRIDSLVTEAWQLASEYGELLLLHRVGYQGKYLPRSNMAMPRSVSVPWVV